MMWKNIRLLDWKGLTLFIILFHVVTQSSSNIFDNEFDEELQSAINDYANEADDIADVASRYKRSADNEQPLSQHEDEHIKCKQSNKKSCCGKKNLFKHFGDHNKTLGKACYEEIMRAFKAESLVYEDDGQSLFSCNKYRMMKKVQYCVFECTGKKRGLLNSDGSLNIIELNSYLNNELFTEPWQKEIGEKSVKKCLKEKYAEWPENEAGIKCNPIAVQFQHCLWKEFERNCPPSEQKNSKKCNKLRESIKQQSPFKRKS